MPRYVAFLRGVSPLNAKMPELKRSFEAAGWRDVVTVLSSGNVVFSARSTARAALERRAELAMRSGLGRSFVAFVRSASELQALIDADPYAGFELAPNAKRVVAFLRAPPAEPVALPIERADAVILQQLGTEVVAAYVPGDNGPVFMSLLERTFGKQITTRTLDTVRRCVAAAARP